MKTCSHCRLNLEDKCFKGHPASADRLQHICIKCKAAYDKQRYEEQREQMIARATAWNKANPVRVRESGRRMDKKRQPEQTRKSLIYAKRVRQATPPWADVSAIKEAYEVAEVLSRGGVQFHVDHEIPIRGKLVSGLHVETNLRVVPWFVNLSKGSKHIQ